MRRAIIYTLNFPFACWFVLIYLCSSKRSIVNQDLEAFFKVHRKRVPTCYTAAFYHEFLRFREFRGVFYYRMGRWIKLISWIYPPTPLLSFDCPEIGGGIFIQHGYCTDISAERIGSGLWVNQRVTIGWNNDGCPTIGNNVHIGTGAVIIGKIIIGDNVKIGANAIVTHDVPSNCTVCPQESMIVKLNGKRVQIKLSQKQ